MKKSILLSMLFGSLLIIAPVLSDSLMLISTNKSISFDNKKFANYQSFIMMENGIKLSIQTSEVINHYEYKGFIFSNINEILEFESKY